MVFTLHVFFGDTKAVFENSKLKTSRGIKSQRVVPCQVLTNLCCGLAVIFCGFISHLIVHKTMNIPEILSGVHLFTRKTVFLLLLEDSSRRGLLLKNKHNILTCV